METIYGRLAIASVEIVERGSIFSADESSSYIVSILFHAPKFIKMQEVG